MPPKAAAELPKTVLLGRPGTHLKMGIVGMPNVGKSTLFNAVSKRQVPTDNRPFCTIDPNIAEVSIQDARFDQLCAIHKPASIVPAQLQIRDIAGLVRGSSQGEGLGNAFLSHICEVDGIYHVCRCFDDESVIHIDGDIDPVRDLDVIFSELIMKDLAQVQALHVKFQSIVERGMDKSKKVDLEFLQKIQKVLESGTQIRCAQWNGKEIDFLNALQLLTAKPAVFIANLSQADFLRQKNRWLAKLKTWIDQRTGEALIPFSCEFESRLMKMAPPEAEAFLAETKAKSQLQKIVHSGYKAINLIHFFTHHGADEVKCWTIQRGTLAPKAAGKIHTDMEKGFICAEVIHWEDFDALRSEERCRDEGKHHHMGHSYEVQDGDIIVFKFNVSKGGKK